MDKLIEKLEEVRDREVFVCAILFHTLTASNRNDCRTLIELGGYDVHSPNDLMSAVLGRPQDGSKMLSWLLQDQTGEDLLVLTYGFLKRSSADEEDAIHTIDTAIDAVDTVRKDGLINLKSAPRDMKARPTEFDMEVVQYLESWLSVGVM